MVDQNLLLLITSQVSTEGKHYNPAVHDIIQIFHNKNNLHNRGTRIFGHTISI